tara:strand:- start:223 stop:660 length:438 start_codon:yes stop_codon:yes gene_type:complete
MNLIKEFSSKKILSLIWQQDGTPYFKAKGTAAGVFCGCFPFFGFQTLLGIFLARIIRGNLALAALGTWISNPFTYIPLYLLNFKIGTFLLNDKNIIIQPSLIKEDFWNQGWFIISRLILGSSIIGLIFGFISGTLTYYVLKSIKK